MSVLRGPDVVAAIGEAVDTVALRQVEKLTSALTDAGLSAADVAAVEAWVLSDYVCWRQELLAELPARLVGASAWCH